MLDWHSCQICYPLEIKLLLLYYNILLCFLFSFILSILSKQQKTYILLIATYHQHLCMYSNH